MIQASPASIAKKLQDDLDLTPPVDLYSICSTLDVIIRKCNIGAEAYLLCKNGKTKILLNSSEHNQNRIRFSLAHELGHLLIPWHDRLIYSCEEYDMHSHDKDTESEANSFAAELIMPESVFRKKEYQICTLETLKKVQDEFDVSLMSAAIRVITINDDYAAVVWCKDGCIKWAYRGKFFTGSIPCRAVEEGTTAFEYFSTKNVTNAKANLNAIYWIPTASIDQRLTEETIPIPSNNSTFSILRIASNSILKTGSDDSRQDAWDDYDDPKDCL